MEVKALQVINKYLFSADFQGSIKVRIPVQKAWEGPETGPCYCS